MTLTRTSWVGQPPVNHDRHTRLFDLVHSLEALSGRDSTAITCFTLRVGTAGGTAGGRRLADINPNTSRREVRTEAYIRTTIGNPHTRCRWNLPASRIPLLVSFHFRSFAYFFPLPLLLLTSPSDPTNRWKNQLSANLPRANLPRAK